MPENNQKISINISEDTLPELPDEDLDIFENFNDDDGSFGSNFTRDIAIISTILICIIAAIYGVFVGQRADMIGTEQAASVEQWINQQEDILLLVKNRVEQNPELMEDPDSFVRYLYNISMQHEQIAVIFICSKNWEQQMYSSDGWIPDDDFNLDEKDYYTQALVTDGMYMTEIYMDVVTGQLCLSIGMKIEIDGYEATVGADIYLDQLVNLMESTYKGVQYASLVIDDIIVTDPSSGYTLSEEKSINIADTLYSSVDGSTIITINHIPTISNTTTIEGTNWQVISVYQLSGVICFFAAIIFLLLIIMFIMRI